MANNVVLIIGSGCTGLLIAQGLKKAGISCTVFEKHEALQSLNQRDWNMGLHWATPVLQELVDPEQFAELHSTDVDPHTPLEEVGTLQFVNGSTGEKLGNGIPVPKWHRLRRSKLRDLLAKGLDIRFKKKLTDISYTTRGGQELVTAVFEDGTTAGGRILVGADGSGSIVRNLIAGPKIAARLRLPYAATFVQAKYTREQALFLRSFHPRYLSSIHPHNYMSFFGMQDAQDPDRPESWTFFFYISWQSSLEQQDREAQTFRNKEHLEHLKEIAVDYTEPWHSAIKWLPEGQPCWHISLSAWDPSSEGHSWSTREGRVTLAGDAAHPMTFQRGQALNHAVTDAGKLTAAITSFILPSSVESLAQEAAIAAYETEMKARGGEEVKMSILNTSMLHDWAVAQQSPVFKGGLSANK